MTSSATTGGTAAPTPIGRSLPDTGVAEPRVSPKDATPAQGIPPVPPAPTPQVTPLAEAPSGPGTWSEPVDAPVQERTTVKVRRTPRRARLYVYRLDAWSVMKVCFMLSVAIAIVFVSAVAGTWWILDYSGVFATIARNVNEVIGSGTTTFDLQGVLAFDRVMGISVVIAALEVALVSVLSGLFAVLYNLTVGITGGVEVTFSDDV